MMHDVAQIENLPPGRRRGREPGISDQRAVGFAYQRPAARAAPRELFIAPRDPAPCAFEIVRLGPRMHRQRIAEDRVQRLRLVGAP